MAEAKQMTRIVAIGKLKSYKYTEENNMGKGQIDTENGSVQFVIFNAKPTAANPHTKAADFENDVAEGDVIFLTGTDSRNVDEEKDAIYESIQVWDYRKAEEGETPRWVFVYVADVVDIAEDGKSLNVSFTNYKDEEVIFPILVNDDTKFIGKDVEVGARIKVKGMIKNYMKLDYFGDGDFVTERTAVEIKGLHTAEEMEPAEDVGDAGSDEMWD